MAPGYRLGTDSRRHSSIGDGKSSGAGRGEVKLTAEKIKALNEVSQDAEFRVRF
jgi:hypothetical protein